MDIAIFGVITLVAILASTYAFALGQVDHIKKNWVQYRCNPMYMPVAGMVGDDVLSNFTKCTMKGFHDYAGFVMDPIMAQFSLVNDTVSEIGDTMNSMRTMFSGVRGGFLGIVGSVFGKIHNLMAQTQYTVIRMRTVLSRIVGVMYSLVYVFYSGMQSGSSVWNGPIGGTMRFLCFDENTKIQTFEGLKAMKDVNLGDRLTNNLSIVTSKYSIDGTGIPIYSLGDILVTGSHKVKYKNKFISVKDHPLAKLQKTSSKRLACLNTNTHRIKIGKFEFLDFVETDDTAYTNFKHRYIGMLYNGNGKQYDEHTGVSGDTIIELANNTTTMISFVKVGDVLQNGDKVKGICLHKLKLPLYSVVDGIVMSPNTWVYKNGKAFKAGDIGDLSYAESPFGVYQLITEKSMYSVSGLVNDELYLLDELETTEEFYHKMKDSIITTGRFRNKVIVV
jgi:hypothetical protein